MSNLNNDEINNLEDVTQENEKIKNDDVGVTDQDADQNDVKNEETNSDDTGATGQLDIDQDDAAEGKEDENSSNKKRVILTVGIAAVLIAGCIGGYAGYNYKQACSEHNQQVEVFYSKANDSIATFKTDPKLLTFEQRLDAIKNAQNNKEILNKEISKDSCKYADGTSPDWTKLLNKYDSIIKNCRNAQSDEWNATLTGHVNFDVNSTEDTDALQQHINSLNGLLNDISNKDNQKLIFEDAKKDSKKFIDQINEQVTRYQTRIDDVNKAKAEAEAKAQEEAAKAQQQAAQQQQNNYSNKSYSGNSGSSYSGGSGYSGGNGYSGGSSNSGSSNGGGGRYVVRTLDQYDANGNYLGSTHWYSDGTCDDPYGAGMGGF